MRMTQTLRQLGPLVVTIPLLFAGTVSAHATAATIPVVHDYDDASPAGQEMYQALKHGEAIQCDYDDCTVGTTVVSITKAEQNYLGLSTRRIAKGVPQGPVSMRLEGAMQHGLFILPIPTWFKNRVIAKHVVAMKVLITDSSKHSGLNNIGAPVNFVSTYPSPDDDPKTLWGQGTRYGCQPLAHGDIIIGFVHYGGTCPKA